MSQGSRSYGSKSADNSKDKDHNASDIKQPTILLKNRDSNVDENGEQKKTKETEQPANISQTPKETETPPPKSMKKSLKLVQGGNITTEHLQDYLIENSDFTVVAVVGPQGVGKSSILNLLTQQKIDSKVKKSIFKTYSGINIEHGETGQEGNQNVENSRTRDTNIFKIESLNDIENCANATDGIDIYVTEDRVIYLDCQPFLSVAVLDELIDNENKPSSIVSDFIPLENNGEIQGLQYVAFLMSVCHVLLVVQDWFFDSNVVRFIQTAEMLKPTISNQEDEFSEHFPHLVMVHNRAEMADFTPKKFKIMQTVYEALFQKTKLQFHSNLGLGSGRIISAIDPEYCGEPVNLFLIPEQGMKTIDGDYSAYPPLNDLIGKWRANICGALRNPLTHVQLTEKTWLHYCHKAWETVKKSPFFLEYTKLMP